MHASSHASASSALALRPGACGSASISSLVRGRSPSPWPSPEPCPSEAADLVSASSALASGRLRWSCARRRHRLAIGGVVLRLGVSILTFDRILVGVAVAVGVLLGGLAVGVLGAVAVLVGVAAVLLGVVITVVAGGVRVLLVGCVICGVTGNGLRRRGRSLTAACAES